MSRKSIPENIKLKLWVKSAGRCEFKGCNKPVWHNDLTLSEGNFAENAHIIGSSKDGPRGNDHSEELQVEFSNLMLLCQKCHKEIDDNPEKYSIELLRKWKAEHEDRIEIQTSYPEDIHKSTVLTCSINIGDRITPINFEAIRNAMFPKYPKDTRGISISENNFDRNANSSEWQSFAENKIKRKIIRELDDSVDDTKVKHLSIYGIAPMPFLFYLGKCIGDTIPCDIYQSHRNIDDTSKTWNWHEDNGINISFNIEKSKNTESKKVYLKISISDYIRQDKYAILIDDNSAVYQIQVTEPTPHSIKHKKQLEVFSYEYRKLLNYIQSTHGNDCEIYILPAVPVSIAIEAGRVILPSKDPKIYVCEYYSDRNGYEPILRIN
jgi:hypothetical protein